MKLNARTIRAKYNQASCWAIKRRQRALQLDQSCGLLTIFHDYEGEYARTDKAEASLYGVTKILDLEEQFGIKATYNIVGKLMLDVPDIMQRIIEGGHDVASHSHAHDILALLNRAELEQDIRSMKEVFSGYGLKLTGVRSPQSRWSFLQTKVMLENGLEWSAENDNGYVPFIIRKKLSRTLIRLPIILDDWEYMSGNISPDEMYHKLVMKADALSEQRLYGAIGFHPWVQGEDDARLKVFGEFLEYITDKAFLKTVTFSEASALARRTAAVA